MSSFTFSDNKLGGRLTAATDAIAAGKLRTAAGIFNELASELNIEAESTDGLLADDDLLVLDTPVQEPKAIPVMGQPPVTVHGQPVDLQMCARNVHAYGQPDSNGWRTCQVCGSVNVAPPDNNGPIDMGARQ